MVETIASPEQLERAERLVTLLDHPNWQELRNVAKDKMNKHFNLLAKELMAGRDIPDLQYRRGFFAGMKFLLDQPDLAQKKLAAALEESTNERN